MSKRGSRVLRYALINAAHNVVKNNSTFKAYYDAKRVLLKLPKFTRNKKTEFLANLYLTFHSWSPSIIINYLYFMYTFNVFKFDINLILFTIFSLIVPSFILNTFVYAFSK